MSAATPITTSDAANDQYVGISAAAAQPTPKTAAEVIRISSRGDRRRAASSAPEIVPMAMMDISRP